MKSNMCAYRLPPQQTLICLPIELVAVGSARALATCMHTGSPEWRARADLTGRDRSIAVGEAPQ